MLITSKGVFGIVRGHANRPLAIDPKTGALFVGVGSSGNIGIEPEVKATIQRFEPDGSGQTTYASGLRNTCGLAIHPDTGRALGRGAGARWPRRQARARLTWCGQSRAPSMAGLMPTPAQHPQPGFANQAPEKVKASKRPGSAL